METSVYEITLPPTEFPDNSLDIVYAYSVFSHLAEHFSKMDRGIFQDSEAGWHSCRHSGGSSFH